ETLDVLAGMQVQILLDLELDREPVAVPPEAPLHVLAAHRPVARDHVLDRPGEEMAVVRQSGRERRAVAEGPEIVPILFLDAPLEDPPFLPEGEHFPLERREIDRRRGLFELHDRSLLL